MIAIADKSLAREILVKRIAIFEKQVHARRRPDIAARARLERDIRLLVPDCRSTGFIETRLDALLIAARGIGLNVPEPESDAHYYRKHARENKEAWDREEATWAKFKNASSGKPTDPGEEKALAKELGVDLALAADEMKRVLRLLSFDAHPDRGGSHERMCKVNRLRELIGARS